MIYDFFHKPHPLIFDWKSVLIPGILAFLILGMFEPFGIEGLPGIWRWGFALGIGGIASLSIVAMVGLLRMIVSREHLEEKWTIGKEILLVLSVLVLICLIIFLAFVFGDFTNQSPFAIFQDVVLKTVLVSLIPIVILVLTEQYFEQRKQLKKIQELTPHFSIGEVTSHIDSTDSAPRIVLENENGKPILKIRPDEVILFRSDGNYLEVFHHQSGGNLQKTLIRNTLKTYVDRLPASDFFHAHKRFLVNRYRIKELRGNARNYEIQLEDFPDWVPVSRSKSADLLALFKG